MNNFITNSETRRLKKRLIELTQKSDELKFLVGFFYFSGIRELYEGLKANPEAKMKVLVGLNVDRFNVGLLEFAENDQISDDEKTHRFFQSIKRSINTEEFDNREFYEQVRFFVDMIRNDRLIIRKTYKPNHAKLYLFKLERGQIARQNLFITGSSNLTKSGLSTRDEFNVEISDYGFEESEDYFDSLWEEAVRITEHDATKDKLIEIIEKDTLVKDVTPFEAFCLVLKTYLDSVEQKEVGEPLVRTLEKNGYVPYKYQTDAVEQALATIEKHQGVIVADVVGLGKTVVACAIAKQLKKRGVIICPPALVGDKNKKSGWNRYAEQFGLYDWEVRSLGDLENTLEFVNTARDIEVVIVDEAHRFRNEDTKGYELLKNICRGKEVILLTATPFNNRPEDIFSLLKLFITPKKSSITYEGNLVDKFRGFRSVFDKLSYIKKHAHSIDPQKRKKAQTYYDKLFGGEDIDLDKVAERARRLSDQIRAEIEPVMIRRNRLDLQNNPRYKTEVKQLSTVADPQEWFFELSKQQSDFYDGIIESYFGQSYQDGRFRGAIYRPFEYEKGYTDADAAESEEKLNREDNRQFQQQRNLFDFMRRLLVKRFESSFGAFEQSIRNFKNVTSVCRDFIGKTGEYILDRDLLEQIYEMDADDIEKYLMEYEEKIKNGEYPKNHKRYKVKGFELKDKFQEDIESDLELYDEILNNLSDLQLVKNDPKVDCLVDNIKRELGKKPEQGEPLRKIIIFSEYVDTVNYLEKALKKQFGDKLLVVSGGALTNRTVEKIERNFDASHPNPEDRFQILLSSDKISEGFNLNRAGMVINYDIPWNPVRVIQRLGRINRISKKVFNELYIVNFFPTEKGAELFQAREIAGNKMFLIHNALGEDSKIFDPNEEPQPSDLYNRVQQNPDKLEKENFYTRALNRFTDIEKNHPELVKKLQNFPPRVKVAKQHEENELLVFFRKERLYVIGARTDVEKPEPYQTTFEDMFGKIECAPDEKALPWNTDRFWHSYDAIQRFSGESPAPLSEQSLESKARSNLDFLIKSDKPYVTPYKEFLRILKKDIVYFGTLADYTLRRIANISLSEEGVKEIGKLEAELGKDYLAREIKRLSDREKELIIAIELKNHE